MKWAGGGKGGKEEEEEKEEEGEEKGEGEGEEKLGSMLNQIKIKKTSQNLWDIAKTTLTQKNIALKTYF